MKVTNYKTSIKYLKKVITTWTKFCESHSQMAKAITFVLEKENNTNINIKEN